MNDAELLTKLKPVFKTYLYDEGVLNKLKDMLEKWQDANDEKAIARTSRNIDTLESRLIDQVNAACIHYKIDESKFLHLMEQYESGLNNNHK